jgi:predicted nucleic acid-binding protein
MLVTATLTIDEVAFTLAETLVAREPYAVTRSRSQYLQAHPDVVKALAGRFRDPLDALTNIVTLEPVTATDISDMVDIMAATGLLPRDAIHLAVMRRLGITAIASDDDAFDGIEGITLYKP